MGKGPLLIRADADSAIGTGHVMRCLALAQAWQDIGGSVEFVASSLPTWVELRLLAEKIRVTKISAALGGDVEPRAVSKLARERNAVWVVLDGYRFEEEYVERVKRFDCKVLKVSDFANARTSAADLILNQNLGVSPLDLFRSRS
jgi:spore coat polysaccharide biosynthesis predicted glycosyltransferase SpsG